MEFKDLTPEQQARANACKTPEEALEFAKELGRELTQDELDQIAGCGSTWGDGKNPAVCPKCGSDRIGFHLREHYAYCSNCGHRW